MQQKNPENSVANCAFFFQKSNKMAQSLMEKLKKERKRAFHLSGAESQIPKISSTHPAPSYQNQWPFEVCNKVY